VSPGRGFVLQNVVTGRYFGGRRNAPEYKAPWLLRIGLRAVDRL